MPVWGAKGDVPVVQLSHRNCLLVCFEEISTILDEINTLFNLPFDPDMADPLRSQQYLDALFEEWYGTGEESYVTDESYHVQFHD